MLWFYRKRPYNKKTRDELVELLVEGKLAYTQSRDSSPLGRLYTAFGVYGDKEYEARVRKAFTQEFEEKLRNTLVLLPQWVYYLELVDASVFKPRL